MTKKKVFKKFTDYDYDSCPFESPEFCIICPNRKKSTCYD